MSFFSFSVGKNSRRGAKAQSRKKKQDSRMNHLVRLVSCGLVDLTPVATAHDPRNGTNHHENLVSGVSFTALRGLAFSLPMKNEK